jgi:hypothetical protein
MKKIQCMGENILVDDEDYEYLIQFHWRLDKRNIFYAARVEGNKSIRMHRELTNCPEHLEVDHIDGNGLNNQKSNLRVVTHRQNCQNRHEEQTTHYPGVYFHKGKGRWVAQIRLKGNKKKHIGYADTAEEAHEKYLAKLEEIGEELLQ